MQKLGYPANQLGALATLSAYIYITDWVFRETLTTSP